MFVAGHVKLGCGTGADVPIFGTGVEELHCWIENKEGVVTLYPYPGVESILVDGLKVTQPTRLTQGWFYWIIFQIYLKSVINRILLRLVVSLVLCIIALSKRRI